MMASGYYPFGSLLPGRNYSSESYNFGFNGQENDNEVHNATGTSVDFGARLLDPRVGRWLAVDPQASKYTDLSPYQFVANSPIIAVDPNGEEIVITGTPEFRAQVVAQLQMLTDRKVKIKADGIVKIHKGLFAGRSDRPFGTQLLQELSGHKQVLTIGAGTGASHTTPVGSGYGRQADGQAGPGSDASTSLNLGQSKWEMMSDGNAIPVSRAILLGDQLNTARSFMNGTAELGMSGDPISTGFKATLEYVPGYGTYEFLTRPLTANEVSLWPQGDNLRTEQRGALGTRQQPFQMDPYLEPLDLSLPPTQDPIDNSTLPQPKPSLRVKKQFLD